MDPRLDADCDIDTEPGKYAPPKAALWIGVYLVLAMVPIAIALAGPLPAPRPFLVEFGVGLGFLGISILALQFVTSGRFRRIAPAFGADVVLQFHRQAGLVAFGLVLAHPILMVVADPDYLEYFDPRVNLLRALALSAVIPIAVALIATSLWRLPTGLNYEWWRVAHGVLALAVVFIGMVHGIQVGHYLDGWWRQGMWVGVLSGAMYLVIHSRVVRPWLMRRRPYEVVSVRSEASDVHTITLSPMNGEPLPFRAGQFVWITLGDTPFTLQQHPFSLSSSEHDATIEVSAKALGDFTETWPGITPGSRAYLEGPYGEFTLDRCAPGAVLVVGGIGVTPALSLLRTMRDTDDPRPVVLLYATERYDDVAFAAEIDELERQVSGLRVIRVPEEPPDDWEGPSGFVDGDLLEAELSETERGFEFYICGPEPMMDAVEGALRQMGVPWRRIYTERFQIV